MLARLSKLATRASELRNASLEKEAVIGKALNILGAGATALAMPGAAMGTYRQHKAGFDPNMQKVMLGQTPVPPQQVSS